MRFVCSTAGCGAISDQRKCEKHRVRLADRETDRSNYEIRKRYRTRRWKRLRQTVILRDGGMCQECKREGRTVVGNEVDHITRAMEDLSRFWDQTNLETLCKRCHSRKTRRGE